MKLKAGTLLVLETGEYSDYSFDGPFRVLRDFDQAKAVEAHKADWKAKTGGRRDQPDADSFKGWLNAHGFIEDVAGVVSWHIGNYGRLKPEIQAEPVSST